MQTPPLSARITHWRVIRVLAVTIFLAATIASSLSLAPQAAEAAAASTTSSLNLRSGPGTSYDVILVMPSGAALKITGSYNKGFYPVRYQGIKGWASADFLSGGGGGSVEEASTTSSSTGTAYTTSSLNLRSGPSTSDSVVAVMSSGSAVSLTGQSSNGFVSVDYNGSSGWAYESYLSASGGGSDSGSGATNSGSSSMVDLIYAAASYYGQDGDDMLRVAQCESGLDPNNVTPPYQASGLFQFLPSTWASTPYASQDIFDPEANAYAAAWMWSVGRRNEWVCQ